MICQEGDIIQIMILLASPILAEQCSKVHLLIPWRVARVLIANSTFLAADILEAAVGIVLDIANKRNIEKPHRNNIVQKPM